MQCKLHYLSWKDIENCIYEIAVWGSDIGVTEADAPTSIYGIPRGGLVPAVMLSHALSMPLASEIIGDGRNQIIVDDICDSGTTMKALELKHPRSSRCALIVRHPQNHNCFAGAEHETEDWFVFPWESAVNARKDHAAYVARSIANQ